MTLNEWLTLAQNPIRVGCFITLFLVLAYFESRYPFRPWQSSKRIRWIRHFSLTIVSKVAIRLVFPVLLIQTAMLIEKDQKGVLYQWPVPFFVQVILGVIALDAMIYLQHRLMHRVKWFWYCHRVHHVDKEIDVSTGIRFHPIEELISMAFKMFGVVFWGVPALGVLLFEIILNFGAMFTHVNIKLSDKAEKYLRWFIVTPGMHRIHHSDRFKEFNSNFGFCLSIWDILFGSYRKNAATGERRLVFGQEEYRDDKYQTFTNLLLLPFNLRRLKPRKKIKRKIAMGISEE